MKINKSTLHSMSITFDFWKEFQQSDNQIILDDIYYNEHAHETYIVEAPLTQLVLQKANDVEKQQNYSEKLIEDLKEHEINFDEFLVSNKRPEAFLELTHTDACSSLSEESSSKESASNSINSTPWFDDIDPCLERKSSFQLDTNDMNEAVTSLLKRTKENTNKILNKKRVRKNKD